GPAAAGRHARPGGGPLRRGRPDRPAAARRSRASGARRPGRDRALRPEPRLRGACACGAGPGRGRGPLRSDRPGVSRLEERGARGGVAGGPPLKRRIPMNRARVVRALAFAVLLSGVVRGATAAPAAPSGAGKTFTAAGGATLWYEVRGKGAGRPLVMVN